MDVSIKLSKGKIVLRAKDDTYLSVRSFLVNHDSNANSKYEMQADERATHERKLLNSIATAVSTLKSEIGKYKITDDLTDEKDMFTITLEMSERMNMSRKKDLERLAEEYIYRKVVSEWWLANYPDAAATYLNQSKTTLDDFVKCLSLKAPFDSIGGVKYKCVIGGRCRMVLLYKEELMNEIHTEMLKLSKSRTNERGVDDLNLQTNEIEDESLLTRYINRHVGRVCSRINAYLYELSDTIDNNSPDRQPVYEFKIVMPEGWDSRLFEQLAEEMHAYIVNASLFDWLKTYIPDAAAVYKSQADVAYDNIKHVVSARKPSSIFKPLQPF